MAFRIVEGGLARDVPSWGDRRAFGKRVQDALGHLYDLAYLQTDPLATILGSEPGRSATHPGKALQSRLIAAIEALGTDPRASADTRSGRVYHALKLRYIESLDLPEVIARLGISRGEYFRAQRRGLDAVTSLLWEHVGRAAPDTTPRAEAVSGDRTAPSGPGSLPGSLPTLGLPLPLSSFVGREQELGEITRLLVSARLVTLTGAGGCGKTRLALQVAADLPADTVALVELAALVDPRLVAPTIAETLGVREAPPVPIMTSIVAALREKKLLLVLDNCEHLLDACAPVVDTLLRGCPTLRVLGTSREPLGIPGEVAWRVPSLATPDPQETNDLSARSVGRFDAIQLFVDRAEAVRPGFALTDATAGSVARICGQLDGIPLAIELAAARLKLFTVTQIAERLGDRFRLLASGPRMAPRRQQTLRATIDWSFDLLGDAERVLFRRLAVFSGAFDLAAVEAVCSADGASGVASEDVLWLLGQLTDKSMVVVEDHGEVTRYRLLDTIRIYAAERLFESGEIADGRRRHAAHYLALAKSIGLLTWGPTVKSGLDRLEAEKHNLRTALSWYRDCDPDSGLDFARLTSCLWFFRGSPVESISWLESMLVRAPGASARRAHALLALGALAAWCRALPVAKRALNECLPMLRHMGDERGVADTLGALGFIAFIEGRYRDAEALLEEGLARAREVGNPDWMRIENMLCDLGTLNAYRNHFTRARELFREADDVTHACGDLIGINVVLGRLADLETREGHLAEAQAILEIRLRRAREIGHNFAIGGTLRGLGRVARLRRDFDRARSHLAEGLALARGNGTAMEVGLALVEMGHLARRVTDDLTAVRYYRDAIEPLQTSNDHHSLVNCLGNVGMQLVRLGEIGPGVHLIGFALATDEIFETALDPDECDAGDASVAHARSALGEEAFARAWAEGKAMTLEQAVALALASGQADGKAPEGCHGPGALIRP